MKKMRPIVAFALRTIKEFYRIKVALFFSFFWVIIWYFLLVYVSGNVGSLPAELQGTAKGQIALAMIVFGFMNTGFTSIAATVSADREVGLYFKLLSTPLKTWQDLLGRTLGTVLFNVLIGITTLIVAFLTGATFTINSWPVLPLVFVIIIFVTAFSFGVGYMIASVIGKVRSAVSVGQGLVVILSFLTGIFIPKDNLPEVLHPLTNFPATIGLAVLKNLLIKGETLADVQSFLYVGLSSILVYFVGVFLFLFVVIWKRAEYR